MKILITGGSGFVGNSLYSKLFSEKNKIISLSSKDFDMRFQNNFKKLKKIKFDKIFHLAAWTQAGDFSMKNPGLQWVNNQLINTNLLSWWQSEQPKAKLISIGSSCVYPSGKNLMEKDYIKGMPREEFLAYGMSKKMLHIGKLSLSQQFKLKYLSVVSSTLYGPNYPILDRTPHFIIDIIKKILIAKKKNKKVELWGSGNQRRESMHIEDFVNQLVLCEKKINNDIINIGPGFDFTIKQWAKIICKIVNYDFNKILFNKNKYTGAKEKKMSVLKLKKTLPNYKSIELLKGLDQTIQGIKKKIIIN